MARDSYDFGVVDRLQATAIGLPGQRTFKIQFANENGETASLWIEKEQLQTLGNAIDQLIAQLSGDPYIDIVTRDPEEIELEPESYFPEPPVVEFKIGRLALGYDEGRGRFTLLIHNIEDEQQGPVGFRCLVTRDQLQTLSHQIDAVIHAGRPRCPLCGTPLSPGTAHFCPPFNGHARVQIDDQ